MNASLTTRIPQNDDSQSMLLARSIGTPTRGTLLSSATRTANTTTSTLEVFGVRALLLFLSISSASAGGLRVLVEYLDPVTSTWRASITMPTAFLAINGLYPLIIGPGLGTLNNGAMSAGSICSLPLTSQIRFTVQHGDANNQTYSLGYEIV